MTATAGSVVLGIAPSTIRPPSRRPGVIVRPDPIKRLLDSSGDRVVIVTAPAGYGKTTTMTLWDEADDRSFAWAHLAPVDDDAAQLLRHVAAALASGAPGMTLATRAFSGPGRSVDLDMLPALAEMVETSPPFVLVLDDVHELRSPAAIRCIDELLTHLPEGSQMALVGRSLPPIRLSRRRLSLGVHEVGPDDLSLDEQDARRLFEQAGLALDENTIGELVRRTEGWPGGLHLAGLALSRRDEASRADAFSGRDRLVADYLVEEVLDGLPGPTVAFLERSALLDAMNAPLLDDLLETDTSARLLREIDQSGNLFLVPLDSERDWYRYHHLFGEMLRVRLQTADPQEARRLHARASAILERQGDRDGAVRHAVAAGDENRAADLILGQAITMVLGGRAAQLRQWLDLLDPPAIDGLPAAALANAWLGLAAGDFERVERGTAAATASSSDQDGPLADGSPSWAIGAAIVRTLSGLDGMAGVLRDCETVRAYGPEANPWWGLATAVEASVRSQMGQLDEARALIDAALPTLGPVPGFEAAAFAHLALLDLYAGDLDGADRHIRQSRAISDRHDLEGVLPTMSVFAIGALVAARLGRTDDARRDTATTRRLLGRIGHLAPRAAMFCYLLLAETAIILGERDDAGVFLDEAGRAGTREPDADELHRRLGVLHDQLADTQVVDLPSPLTSAERRVLPFLATHLSLQEIADQLFISRNTAKSHSVAIYRKLGVSSRSEAVTEAQRLGLLTTV